MFATWLSTAENGTRLELNSILGIVIPSQAGLISMQFISGYKKKQLLPLQGGVAERAATCNTFYCCFEKPDKGLPTSECRHSTSFVVQGDDVRFVLKHTKSSEETGP